MGFKEAMADLQRTVDAQVADAVELSVSLGRPRDHSRDPVILEAALDVLAQTGYEAMTIEMVAAMAKAGKATLYRRWPSKAHIVVDAVASMATFDADPSLLPDTGSLRGDLLALVDAAGLESGGDRNSRIVAGLCSVFPREPDLAAVVRSRLLEPRAALIRALLERARERGEVPADRDLDLIAEAIPAMIVYRMIFLSEPIAPDLAVAIIDEIVLPAAGVTGSRPSA